MSRRADVVVVGGGVIGCSVSWALAREGLSVRLLERERLAAEASGAAAGMLLPFGESESGRVDADSADDPFRAWAVRGLEMFPELCGELRERSGIDPEYEASGAVYIARSSASCSALAAKRERLPGAGFEWLDARAAADAVPGLSQGVCGALWSPREAHVRSPQLARAYAVAAESLGARVEPGAVVTGLLCVGDRCTGVTTAAGPIEASVVVVCAGAWSPSLLPVDIPIEPVRGQIAAFDNPTPPLRSIVIEGPTYLVPKRDGSLVVGATEEAVGFDRRVTPEGLAGLVRGAGELVPGLANTGFRDAWAGLRPATPDRLPVVGPVSRHEGLFVAAGHFRNGVLLSPVTGALIAAQVLGKPVSALEEAFRVERFQESSRGILPGIGTE